MALVVLPNTLTNGEVADADEVQGNDNALREGVNNVEAEQIVNGTITNDKLAEGLEHVSQADGREEIKKLKNTGNINPADVLSYNDETKAYQAKKPPTQQAPL